ncbi:MAG: D-alanyl-D-alanine carboxypeptidase family protein [Pseudomonadota bacterium]|nr:D-alanyl-D-alanine carboxypeptidase family protein [Pseudomonadota bacterium]
MKRLKLCMLFLILFITSINNNAHAIETRATHAILVDFETGMVLFEHNPDTLMSPASMSKLMTVLMVFEAVEDGRISMNDKFFVSDDAWRRGGSKSGSSTMFLNARSRVSVENLLRGVIIQSGNDACIALAEGLGGSELGFAEMMTERARDLGMENSTFVNSTGWPDEEHKTTARDLAYLTKHLIKNHFSSYGMFAERSFTWNGITQQNRNPLLYANMGADGLKTGHTQDSGYGLVASAEQNGRRLILVVNGLQSKKERASEARKLMNWGFRAFTNDALATPDDVLVRAPVWQGEFARVGLAPFKAFRVVLPRTGLRKMVVTASYDKPILAPITKGMRVGKLRVTLPGLETQEIDLVTTANIEREGMLGRALSAISYVIFGE